jgi:hypothetical protein
MGIRYRFNDGIAARGRFKGKNKPVLDDPELAVKAAGLGLEGMFSHL